MLTMVGEVRRQSNPRNMWGPDMAPHTPRPSDRPGKAVAVLDTLTVS